MKTLSSSHSRFDHQGEREHILSEIKPSQNWNLTDEEWRQRLTPEQFQVTRRHGTERAFTGPWLDEKRAGIFHCIACDQPLFETATKYESGSGWPSFFKPVNDQAISEHLDESFGMRRVEIRCARCDSHVGHVFPDGPKPTGLRYCTNGVALDFKPETSS